MSQTFQPLSVRGKEMSLDTGNFIKLGIRLHSEQCLRCVFTTGIAFGGAVFWALVYWPVAEGEGQRQLPEKGTAYMHSPRQIITFHCC